MAKDNDINAGGQRVEIKCLEIVEYVKGVFADCQQVVCRIICVDVHIAADGMDRGDSGELRDNAIITDIAGMNDGIAAFEVIKSVIAQ